MKLYLILFHFNAIAGVIGPLPYGFGECVDRAREMIVEIDEKAARKPEVGVKPGDYTAECRHYRVRPQLTEK